MPTTYGLTSTGFVAKTFEVIRAEIVADVQAAFGASVDVSDGSLLGILIAIVAEREALVWDLAQLVDSQMDPDEATGEQLDALCALTGTFRADASASTVTLTLTGTVGTSVPSGSKAATSSTSVLFQTTSAALIATVTAWAATTAYVVGDRRNNGGNVYQCITAGTSAGAGGPTTTASDITDGSVHWTYLGSGAGAVDVAARSVSTGPIVGAARDISVINTPVGGWSSVINLLDATLGADEQTDESLRVTREYELARAGVSTPDAIRAAILQVSGVTNCQVFYNNTDATTGTLAASNLLPPHSVEALVVGGTDQAVLNALFASVAAGIAFAANGNVVSGTVTDASGVAQAVQFSRPTDVNIYVDITYKKDAATYPSDGDTQVKNAIVAYGQAQVVGKDAVASGIAAAIFPVYVAGVLVQGVAGILDVTATLISTTPGPVSSATIVISDHQRAAFDTSRITVHTSSATP